MKSIFFSLLFALSTLIPAQAQDALHVIVTNNTSSSWTYKLGSSGHGILINQVFAPNSSTEFTIAANDYEFPLFWSGLDAGGCSNSGTFSEPTAPSSTNYSCTNAVLTHAFAASSGGILHLFVSMD